MQTRAVAPWTREEPMTAAIARPAVTDVVAAPLSPERANSLFRWNAVLAGLHGIQAFIILAISLATDPVVSLAGRDELPDLRYRQRDPRAGPARRSSICPSGRRWRSSCS